MIRIDNTLISEELTDQHFICNLDACKGACCVEGDAGAPLEEEEIEILKKELPAIKPFLCESGIAAIDEQGVNVYDGPDAVTPLVNDKECAYAVFEEDGRASCGIEKAHIAGATDFKKPVSCHLYPVRVTKYPTFTSVNYHPWDICSHACVLGESKAVKLYQFLKEPLIRKFGQEWFDQIEEADNFKSAQEEL